MAAPIRITRANDVLRNTPWAAAFRFRFSRKSGARHQSCKFFFARPRLKIRAGPASLKQDETKEAIVATTQEAVQISAIVPSLTVDDLQKSIAFYEALGFAIDERWEEKGTLLGVMLRAGKTEIGLSQDDWKKGRDRKKGIGVRVSISRRRATSTRSRDR